MPPKLATSLLTLETAKMHHIDTRNVENLYGMWSVFSKCAEAMENGRRYENMSWRIWNRETLCCERQPHLATPPPMDIKASKMSTSDLPDLSVSVDSVSSVGEEQDEVNKPSHTAPMDIQLPRIRDLDARSESSRGRERHITSLKLEKMVVSIKEKQEITPLSPSITDAVRHVGVFPTAAPLPTSHSLTVDAPLHSSDSSASTGRSSGSDQSTRNTAASDTSAETLASHSVVRGFSPGQISSSYRSNTHLVPSPVPVKSIVRGKKDEGKPNGMFLLGGSSGEDDSSFDDQMLSQPRHSSLTAGLKRPLQSKKQTSFKDEVESRTINNRSHEDEDVFESDDEDEVSESAIEDDDEVVEEDDGSDWEDSISETAEPMANDKQLFQRVDSRPNLVSRRSLLTTLMHEPDRAAAFANLASKSTSALRRSRRSSPNGPSTGTSPEAAALTMCGSHMTPAKPIIMTTSNTNPPALSPRSTRRGMLSKELSESLRKHLLWERQQRSTTANAVLKRRHTAFDLTRLQDQAGVGGELSTQDGSRTSAWNKYFDPSGEYNQAGCRAGSDCPFVHDPSSLERARPQKTPQSRATSSRNLPEPTQTEEPIPRVTVDGVTQSRPSGRRFQPPPVDATRVIQRPVPRSQKESPRDFQIRQLERRFPSLQKIEHGTETTLAFQLPPSDPDFPFELSGLECVLHVPSRFPGDGKPSLLVTNKDMPRGYQINVERGFEALVQASPQATLLSLLNALDKRLESLLTGEKADTIKIMPNASRKHGQLEYGIEKAIAVPARAPPVQESMVEQPQFTPEQRRTAQARRDAETRQLEARLGRLPLFSKSSDGILFLIPIIPRSPGNLPVPLQAVRSVKLFVPLLYPLRSCRIEVPGVSKEAASKAEEAFERRMKANAEMSLLAHINYFAQHMHTLAIEPHDESKATEHIVAPIDTLQLDEQEKPTQGPVGPDNDRSHIKIIPRPPEWNTGGEEESDSDSDFSCSDGSGDEFEEEHQDNPTIKPTSETASSQPSERGVSLSFPSLELYNIELLSLTSLSLSTKCTRCKTPSEISNLLPSTPRHDSCSKCAQPFSLTYRPELIHANSFRAGYLDLNGCTILDMLPSAFIPTCSTCSAPVPAPGVVSVRGSAASIAICRSCHTHMSFALPETKFMLVSNQSLHPRHLLPLRRKAPKENLGIVAGQELPHRGRCKHYSKSYRWFRFSCCAKVYACDKCHDEAEAHPNEHANRMICGFCAREQHYRPEDCAVCRKVVVGKKGSGFWEGGKGTRDKARMSRKGESKRVAVVLDE
ncbi:MAG: hypothetical protein Q9208_000269 [Pyrenodesmia sp. 3 TL-2023]